MAKPKEKNLEGKSSKDEGEAKQEARRSRALKPDKKNRKGQAWRGPRLPSGFRKELDRLNHEAEDSGDEIVPGDQIGELSGIVDVYECDEPIPQEESKKNRRFDSVDNLEYELPYDFKDENVSSDNNDDEGSDKEKNGSDASEVEVEEDDDDRHARMLHGITGMPSEAFQGKKRKGGTQSEANPESEYSCEASDGPITIQDLLDPLHGEPVYSKLRKRMHQLETRSLALQVPLPKSKREELERKAAYEQSKKDITKWEPLVKRNREAPTVFFDEDIDIGYSTVGAIASEFEPRTQLEQKMTSLLSDLEVVEAHEKDGARLLELNKVSVEDVKDRQNHLAKMRSLLFHHELKAKRIKKIKSKTYRRISRKDKSKEAAVINEMDSENARELRMKQEFKRAEERMRLTHKNTSKWAQRLLKRGLNNQDINTQLAISEQLHKHQLLTMKQNSIGSSSDESSDADEDEFSSDLDGEGAQALLKNAKDKTQKVLEEEDKTPKTGVLSLPFMVRGIEKRKEAVIKEAEVALQEFDVRLKDLESGNELGSSKLDSSKGRRVFGVGKNMSREVKDTVRVNNVAEHSDDDDEFEAEENFYEQHNRNVVLKKEVQVDPTILLDESDAAHQSVFKSISDIAQHPGPKTTFEVSIFASDSWQKINAVNEVDGSEENFSKPAVEDVPHQELKDGDHNSDTDCDDAMVDGVLTSPSRRDYELPSQEDLIHRAFAGDDVEEEFEKDKMEILNQEIPEPEKPVSLPGWGQWTDIQKKKGLPAWKVDEHEKDKKKREDALNRRKDAQLKHVIISEKVDKRAEKLLSRKLPFPYTSKEVFEQSIRMPIGPEFNPATSVGALNRPPVVKKAGVIIKPIQFEEVTPQDESEEANHNKKALSARVTEKGNIGKHIRAKEKRR